MALSGVIDDHTLQQYRMLLDAEDAAFDGLEHAFEDGDRAHWEDDLHAWQTALSKKVIFLQQLGIEFSGLDA